MASSVVMVHGAEHRHVGVVLDHGPQLGLVARAAELVEDDSGNADTPVKRLVAEDQWRNAARHAARIDHQHHRRVQQCRQRGVGVAAVQIQPVVQTLVAFDQGDIGPPGATRERGADLVARHQIEIEVVAVAPGGQAEPHRIDVVRTLLEGLHGQATCFQGRAQSDGERGFARGLVGGGDEEPVHTELL